MREERDMESATRISNTKEKKKEEEEREVCRTCGVWWSLEIVGEGGYERRGNDERRASERRRRETRERNTTRMMKEHLFF